MIDIIDIPEDYRGSFFSAYKQCKKKIEENGGIPNPEKLESIILLIVKRYQFVFEEKQELLNILKDYLFQEIICSSKVEDTTGVYSDQVRNKHWWTDFKNKNSERLNYWARYSEYLIEKKNWDPVVIDNSIDSSTDKIMNALADPTLRESQDIRGIVFGHVQSGKTAHYIGLINKAIDAGYKIVIILAGIHNNLRSQTQTRVDEEVLGFESSLEAISKNIESELRLEEGNRLGVGLFSRHKSCFDFPFQVCTSRDENGDFNHKRAESLTVNPPLLAVIKKSKSSLESLRDYWKKKSPIGTRDKDGNTIIGPEYPLLLIDDEADQASLNTKLRYNSDGELLDKQSNPTSTNRNIRDLLNLFSCKSYVGYSATPYANIFIPPEQNDKEIGEDLFPRDFIIKMPQSPKYFGANDFFGWKKEDNLEMPLYRPIESQIKKSISNKQSSDIEEVDQEKDFDIELSQAIQMFFLSTAIRNCRDQRNKPNTMLIHTDRKVDEHSALFKEVSEYLQNLKNMIAYNDSFVLNELKELWEKDYLETTEIMRKYYPNRISDVGNLPWENIKKELYLLSRSQADDEVKCKIINGNSKDFLDYKYHSDRNVPYNVIIIGGDKLSRGLTLEGLSVSYFTRISRKPKYDTLMQMGRWFGYRPGYLDLCRLFVTPDIYDDFRHISLATEDLIRQIDYMNDLEDATPHDFGLRVLTHPQMEISNKNKIGSGTRQYLSYSNTATQATRIDVNAERYRENYEAVEKLINALGLPMTGKEYEKKLGLKEPKNHANHLFWSNVSGQIVANFFKKFKASKKNYRANSNDIVQYIEKQLKCGGVKNWTICLINVGKEKDLYIGSLPKPIGHGISRNVGKYGLNKIDKIYSLKTLTSNDHEYLDYSQEEWDLMERIKSEKIKNGAKRVSADYLRGRVRDKTKALLILYPLDVDRIEDLKYGLESESIKTPFSFAVVFPHNGNKDDETSYWVNMVARKAEEEIDDEDQSE